jgi:hypothetical protein
MYQKIELETFWLGRTRQLCRMNLLFVSSLLWATAFAQTLSTLLVPVEHSNVTQIHTYDLASGNTTLSRAILSFNSNSLTCAPTKPSSLGLGTITSDWATQSLFTTCSVIQNTSTAHTILSLKAPKQDFQEKAYKIAIANHVVLLLASYSNTSFYIVTVPNDPKNQTTVLWHLDVRGYPRVITSADTDGWYLSTIHIYSGRLYALGNNGSVTSVLTWSNPLPSTGEAPLPLPGTPASSLITAFTFTAVDNLLILLSATSIPEGLSYPILAQYRYASSSKQWFLNTQYLFQNRSHVPLTMTSQSPQNQFKFYGVTLQQVVEYTLGITAGMTTVVETRVLSTAPKGFKLQGIAYLPGPTSVPVFGPPTPDPFLRNTSTQEETPRSIRASRLQSISVTSDSVMSVPSWSVSPLPTRSPLATQQNPTPTQRPVATQAPTLSTPTATPFQYPTPNATEPALETTHTSSGSALRLSATLPPQTVVVVEQSSHLLEIVLGITFGVLVSTGALGVTIYFLLIRPAQKAKHLPTHAKTWKPPVAPRVRPTNVNPMIQHGIHPGVLGSVEEARTESVRLNASRQERVEALKKVQLQDTPTLQGQEEGNAPELPLI